MLPKSHEMLPAPCHSKLVGEIQKDNYGSCGFPVPWSHIGPGRVWVHMGSPMGSQGVHMGSLASTLLLQPEQLLFAQFYKLTPACVPPPPPPHVAKLIPW